MTIFGQQTEADKPKHPSSSWANWKNGKFMVWDKTIPSPTEDDPDHMWAEVEIKLPKEFIIIAQCYCCKWYLQDKEWVWSNEVDSTKKDIMTIKANKTWEVLYEWTWNDIKWECAKVQLKLTTNIHYVDPKEPDVLRTFSIKWAASKEWYEEFYKRNKNAQINNTVTLNEIKKWKTWSVTYTYPSFTAVKPLTPEQRKIQTEWGAKLVVYRGQTAPVEDTAEAIVEETAPATTSYNDDDLPF